MFMPTERDIRETCDQLEGLIGGKVVATHVVRAPGVMRKIAGWSAFVCPHS